MILADVLAEVIENDPPNRGAVPPVLKAARVVDQVNAPQAPSDEAE